MDRDALERAYRQTAYRVGKVTLRVDEPHPWLDILLKNRGLEHYAYITAVNPRSEQLPEDENARRTRALTARLEERPYLRGVAVAEGAGDAVWPPEPSLLVLGIAPADALALGREFGQNAILVGKVGGSPQLVWTDVAA